MSELCVVAKIKRSSFYYWKLHQNDRAIKDQSSLDFIKNIYEYTRGKEGIRLTQMKIDRLYGVKINLKKIARIKKEYNLPTKIRRKKRFSFYSFSHQESRTKENLLNRNFNPEYADSVYSTDITEMRFNGSQKVYISAVKDLCTREIITYAVNLQPRLTLSLEVATECLKKLSVEKREKLIIHSDQGVHYTSHSYRNILSNYNVKQSMSRKGNCLDNAPIESFFGHMKDELDLTDCKDYLSVKDKIKKYMSYYNNNRPQWGLKAKTPAEYRGFIEGNPFFNLS